MATSGITSVRAEPFQHSGIIARLTEADHADAVACGRSGAECSIAPYQLCPSELSGRYSARIATPYSRVASAVFEGARSGRPARGIDRGLANQWGIGIYVFPAERSIRADAIQRVEIRREGRMIQPLTTTVGPLAVTLPDGASKTLTRGYFAFGDDVFTPSESVTVVLIGAGGESTCFLDRSRLERLR